VEALPYGGLTNAIYKDSQLIMRKIPAGIFPKGEEGIWECALAGA